MYEAGGANVQRDSDAGFQPAFDQMKFNNNSNAYQSDGAAKSHMRLQLTSLRNKMKELERDIDEKEAEIVALQKKTGQKANEDLKAELRKAFDVLRHLKKKVGNQTFSEEYKLIMREIRQALGVPQQIAAMKEADAQRQRETDATPVGHDNTAFPSDKNSRPESHEPSKDEAVNYVKGILTEEPAIFK